MKYTAPPEDRTSKIVEDVLTGGNHLSDKKERMAVAERYVEMERTLGAWSRVSENERGEVEHALRLLEKNQNSRYFVEQITVMNRLCGLTAHISVERNK